MWYRANVHTTIYYHGNFPNSIIAIFSSQLPGGPATRCSVYDKYDIDVFRRYFVASCFSFAQKLWPDIPICHAIYHQIVKYIFHNNVIRLTMCFFLLFKYYIRKVNFLLTGILRFPHEFLFTMKICFKSLIMSSIYAYGVVTFDVVPTPKYSPPWL